MKKLILTAAAAMMVLASCTKTTVESIDGPKEIAFKKIEGAMTKETLDQLNDKTMGVFAYLNGEKTQYFGNTKFSKVDTYWEGDRYWPLNGQALDFVVYAPYIANAQDKDGIQFTYTTTPEPPTKKLTFTIKNNSMSGSPASQIDYLYGAEFYNDKDHSYDGYNKNNTNVPVTLKHALAKITLKVKANDDNVFTITSLTLKKADQAGTISITYSPAAGAPDCDIADTPIEQDYSFTEFKDKLVKKSETIDATYLVFPSEQESIDIKYKMEGLGETELTTTLNLQGNWDSGKHYIYNLTLTANKILFNPTVDDWDDEVVTNKDITTDGDVNLP